MQTSPAWAGAVSGAGRGAGWRMRRGGRVGMVGAGLFAWSGT
ncbi:MAG: hypothetical protein AVDCRST_MAG18-4194 [uncultured Thermomicrobiales bacterium]|uniref:Uncharacterized protein n=1 Tax=uncultured Thermomicrobiales bacterium TaxID=1645740 RepID=A0A6J4VTJ8_9BACT|nr:MAG: hypothetical protein AVDCRST_MAG18-4194 [uncultured Thermomicrobiales bacterium]